MLKRKIIIITGTRADYGLLKKLIFKFQADLEFETFVAATGTHLSKKHGHTIDIILEDKIKNILTIDLNQEGDGPADVSHSIAKGIEGFTGHYLKIKPEFIIVLGDRYELLSACIPALIFNIPIVHIHGGESTQGVIDEAIRHSITKMSHLHLCSHEIYKRRILQLGESQNNVHVVGAAGLDRILEMSFLDRENLSSQLKISFKTKNILCTFHPVTLDVKESELETEALVSAFKEVLSNKDVNLFITYPNSDTNASTIKNKWDELIAHFPNQVYGFVSLGDLRYLSLMLESDLVVGNSSSGIIEAPFLKKAVVDIGARQLGRLCSKHIIHCNGDKESILNAINKGLSDKFQSELASLPSIYGNGNTTQMMYDLIRSTKFKNIVFKKFNDGYLK